MSSKRKQKKISKKTQAAATKRQVDQLHSNLKRGLLPYSILFLLKQRNHYSLEIHRKLSAAAKGYFNINRNIVYHNLAKFEGKGMVGSYLEKSTLGPNRKYYYLTDFGERVFEETVIKNLYPVMLLFLGTMEKVMERSRMRSPLSRKELAGLKDRTKELMQT
jgi:PadR family transcriptional regulator PadR